MVLDVLDGPRLIITQWMANGTNVKGLLGQGTVRLIRLARRIRTELVWGSGMSLIVRQMRSAIPFYLTIGSPLTLVVIER